MTTELIRNRKQELCNAFLTFLDSIVSIFIFAPLVVGYWRGCWQLTDRYLLPDDKEKSLWISFAIGAVPGLFFCLTQSPIERCLNYKKFPKLHFFLSRLYTVIYCVISVNHWRGVWTAWDYYTGISWISGLGSALVGLFTLAITRGLVNILAPPFIVVTDHPKHYFAVPTQFGTQKEGCCRFLLDSVFTVVVTGSLVVFVWRGTWIFLDNKLFPGEPKYSAWGSMVIGGTVTIISFVAQMVMIPCLARMKKSCGKIFLEDIYHTFCFLGDINIWRGVWNLLNIYLYPDDPVLSNWLTVLTGLIILMIFYTSNSILVRGAKMDGSLDGEFNIIFPIHYFRFFYKKKLAPKPTLQSYWMREDEEKIQAMPSAPVVITNEVSKNNIYDARGYGDGNSCSEPTPDDSREGISSPQIVNSIYASEVVPVTIPSSSDLISHQSETVL